MIEIDLSSQSFRLEGETTAITEALGAALLGSGARRAASARADILVLTAPLLPDEGFRAAALLDRLESHTKAMSSGRIVLLISAAGLVPLRRFPRYSAEMASLVSAVRSEAMRLAPAVLVNAVAAGQIGTKPLAGDAAMLGHAPLGRAGETEALAGAVLFFCDPLNSYCTGQSLAVDGGWSTGFARSF